MGKISLVFGLVLLLVGCAVVNVYVSFPQEKIEKAMESLELEIQKGPLPAKPAAFPKKESRLLPGRFLEPTPLYAQTISRDPKTDSPVISEAQARRRERISDIQSYKETKIIGENKDGLLEVRSTAGLNEEEMAGLQKVLKEENRDRMTIYQEIVRINNMPPSDMRRVQAAFAKMQRKMAKEGEWIQNEDGAWVTEVK
ncbi:MAG: DUF1318 domain-containing protein [Candidatus Omnitrophota bacterium]